jgi:hypothetical protein
MKSEIVKIENIMNEEEDVVPRMTVKPYLKQEDNGNKMLIQCQVEAWPRPEVKWFKENIRLLDSDRIKSSVIEASSLSTTKKNDLNKIFTICLEIDNLTSDDGGQYIVKAENYMGKVSAYIFINFAGRFFFMIFLNKSLVFIF